MAIKMSTMMTWRDIEDAMVESGLQRSEANRVKRACKERKINEAAFKACVEGIADSDADISQFYIKTLKSLNIPEGVRIVLLRRIKHTPKGKPSIGEEPEVIDLEGEEANGTIETAIKQENIKQEVDCKQEPDNEVNPANYVEATMTTNENDIILSNVKEEEDAEEALIFDPPQTTSLAKRRQRRKGRRPVYKDNEDSDESIEQAEEKIAATRIEINQSETIRNLGF